MGNRMMGDLSINFSRSEFACKCECGFDTVDIELVKLLENIRAHFNKPVHINSGCRCAEHNAREGGSKNSQHLYGRAADIFMMTIPPVEVAKYIDSKWPNRYGVGIYNSWVHVDTRTKGPSRWG